MFIHGSCCVVFFTASACVISSMTLSDHSFVSPCLLILLDLRVSACIFYCMGQCANVPRLLQHALMVIKVDCVLRHMCNAVRVRARGILTLACWHGATPGAVAGAGPRDSLVPSDHHVARLAHECHILAHCGVIPGSETVGWNAGVTTGDHCRWWSNTRNLHQTLF